MKTIGEFLGNKLKPLPTISPPTALAHLPNYPSFVGVEIELENFNADTLVRNTNFSWFEKFFNLHRDPSLRNNGQEIVTRAGITLSNALYNLYHLLDDKALVKKLGWEVSPRCSVHVHWNMQDKTDEQLKQILLVYMAIEPVLFSISGNRNSNIFCVPLLRNIPKTLMAIIAKPDLYIVGEGYGAPHMSINWGKYSALNLIPLTTQGTIEFRHHEGTLNFDRIKNWLLTINNLVEFACKFKSPSEVAKHLQNCIKDNDFTTLIEIFLEYQQGMLEDIRFATAKTAMLYDTNSKDFREDRLEGFLPEVKKSTAKAVEKEKYVRNIPPPGAPRIVEGDRWDLVREVDGGIRAVRRPGVARGQVNPDILDAINRARQAIANGRVRINPARNPDNDVVVDNNLVIGREGF